jgi:NAD+ diphosphatase
MLMSIRPPLLAAQKGLNRRAEKRADSKFVDAALKNPNAKVLALFDLKVPIVPLEEAPSARIRWLTVEYAKAIAAPLEFVFLGEDDTGAPVFACNFLPFQTAQVETTLEEMKPLVDLRSLALQGVLGEAELLAASQARALLGWIAVNRCCTRCGGLVRSADAGWRRHCGACGVDTHPRMDPAVIMLIIHGDRCLLGHEHRFPEKLYSTLAGFVEPGDDIEHAVRREIKEEAGIDVGEVGYVASQPWPFPHSLMIGCWGEAQNNELSLDSGEVADARWFTREEVVSMLASRHPDGLIVPPRISMAHTLIRAFVDGAIGR